MFEEENKRFFLFISELEKDIKRFFLFFRHLRKSQATVIKRFSYYLELRWNQEQVHGERDSEDRQWKYRGEGLHFPGIGPGDAELPP